MYWYAKMYIAKINKIWAHLDLLTLTFHKLK